MASEHVSLNKQFFLGYKKEVGRMQRFTATMMQHIVLFSIISIIQTTASTFNGTALSFSNSTKAGICSERSCWSGMTCKVLNISDSGSDYARPICFKSANEEIQEECLKFDMTNCPLDCGLTFIYNADNCRIGCHCVSNPCHYECENDCPWGHKQDPDGCPTFGCICKGPCIPECVGCRCQNNITTQMPCPEIQCPTNCPSGKTIITEANFCKVCKCDAGQPIECPSVICSKPCPNGLAIDENNCQTCECLGRTDDVAPVCPGVLCPEDCLFGFLLDKSKECAVCECAKPCDAAPHTCLEKCDYFGSKMLKGCQTCDCNNPRHTCKDIECPEGQICKMKAVQCVRPPCAPVPQCSSIGEAEECFHLGQKCMEYERCHNTSIESPIMHTEYTGYFCTGEDREVTKEELPQTSCFLEPQTGHCRGSFLRFYFNYDTGNCEEFTYGGCGGNLNNFATEKECYFHCFGRNVVAPKCIEQQTVNLHDMLMSGTHISPSTFHLKCDAFGNYEKEQCDPAKGVCWCVNMHTGKAISGTQRRGHTMCDTKKMVCPQIDPHTVGICSEECNKYHACPRNLLCCSNGCGHVCVGPVPIILPMNVSKDEPICPKNVKIHTCEPDEILSNCAEGECFVNPCGGCKSEIYKGGEWKHVNASLPVFNETDHVCKMDLTFAFIANAKKRVSATGRRPLLQNIASEYKKMVLKMWQKKEIAIVPNASEINKLLRMFKRKMQVKNLRLVIKNHLEELKNKSKYHGQGDENVHIITSQLRRMLTKVKEMDEANPPLHIIQDIFMTHYILIILNDLKEYEWPRCSQDGLSFDRMQCDGMGCFCVDTKTGNLLPPGDPRKSSAYCDFHELNDTECRDGRLRSKCRDMCDSKICGSHPEAICITDECNDCKISFKLPGGEEVSDCGDGLAMMDCEAVSEKHSCFFRGEDALKCESAPNLVSLQDPCSCEPFFSHPATRTRINCPQRKTVCQKLKGRLPYDLNCDKEGGVIAKQCDQKGCFCVTKFGKEVAGTREYLDEAEEIAYCNVMKTKAVDFSFKLDMDYKNTIGGSSEREERFKDSLKRSISSVTDINEADIHINSITEGSILVNMTLSGDDNLEDKSLSLQGQLEDGNIQLITEEGETMAVKMLKMEPESYNAGVDKNPHDPKKAGFTKYIGLILAVSLGIAAVLIIAIIALVLHLKGKKGSELDEGMIQQKQQATMVNVEDFSNIGDPSNGEC